MVCLSKSISGMGLPMSLLLMDPALDVWSPGEHTGTFRGFNYAFVTANAALEQYWGSSAFSTALDARCRQLAAVLHGWRRDFSRQITRASVLGMFAGIELRSEAHAHAVQQACFAAGLIVECCGALSDTLKLLPPVLIEEQDLDAGLRIFADALARHG
jgi:diaminobutyrate-2-oxoglutarate transaminase